MAFPFSLFTVTYASCSLPQWQNFFISWRQYFASPKRHKWSFMLYIVLFSGLKMIFSRFSQLDINVCIKTAYNNFNICCYFMSSIIERLYKSLFCNSSVQISTWIRNSQEFFNHIQKQPLELFYKTAILRNFVIFTAKHLCWGLFFIKVAGFQASNCIKKGLQHRYFLVNNIRKFIRTSILKN